MVFIVTYTTLIVTQNVIVFTQNPIVTDYPWYAYFYAAYSAFTVCFLLTTYVYLFKMAFHIQCFLREARLNQGERSEKFLITAFLFYFIFGPFYYFIIMPV